LRGPPSLNFALAEHALERKAKNLPVVECQSRRPRGRVPPGVFRIICGYGADLAFKHCGEDYAYGMAARVAPRIAERAYLMKRDSAESGFFAQLARGGIFKRFVLINESARKGPSPLERLAPSLDEHNFRALAVAVKENNVNRHRRARVLVAVSLSAFLFIRHCHYLISEDY
jgi:hypothetical protein